MSGYGDEILGGMSKYAHRDLSNKQRTVFRQDYRVRPGKLPLQLNMKRWARGAVQAIYGTKNRRKPILLSPHTKRHKDWGWQHWLDLLPLLEAPLLQCQYKDFPLLPGVPSIHTETFFHAAAVLAACRGLITVEGGMHHAAGALRMPAVVIMGAVNPPHIMGYTFHENLAVDDPNLLGLRTVTPETRAAFDSITPEMVAMAAEKLHLW